MLEAKNIHKFFKSRAEELHVLKGVDFRVEKGEVVSILGPSGAGKSTLLHILGGLDEPSEGTVLLSGSDMYRLFGKRRFQVRNQDIGFVFQFYHLLPEFTALENVMLPALMGSGTGDKKPKAQELLDSVGLKNRATHKPSQLSGGEQQRVAIARALINRPKLLLCDEPTGNLDSETGQGIIDMIYKLHKEKETTVVIVSHEEKIARMASRVLCLRDGRLK